MVMVRVRVRGTGSVKVRVRVEVRVRVRVRDLYWEGSSHDRETSLSHDTENLSPLGGDPLTTQTVTTR